MDAVVPTRTRYFIDTDSLSVSASRLLSLASKRFAKYPGLLVVDWSRDNDEIGMIVFERVESPVRNVVSSYIFNAKGYWTPRVDGGVLSFVSPNDVRPGKDIPTRAELRRFIHDAAGGWRATRFCFITPDRYK